MRIAGKRARRSLFYVLFPISVAAALLQSCDLQPSPPPLRPSESARAALESRVGPPGTAGPVHCGRDRLCGSDVLADFYRARGLRPAWVDDTLALADADALVQGLREVAADGLNPGNYHLSAIEGLLAEVRDARAKEAGTVSPESLADLEMLLTDAFLLCGSHLVHGQLNPETNQSEWSVKGRTEDLAAALETGLAEKNIPGALASLRPSHAVYQGLRAAYHDFGALASAGGWPPFPPGSKLERGDAGPRIQALRASLAAMGEYAVPAEGAPLYFDKGLEASVKAFQRRHGLEPDGLVGARTQAALNVTAQERLTQIRANLERWRWITHDLGERYILINVADFRVSVVENGKQVLSMAAIVGRPYRSTPEFSGRLTHIEVNPTWSVPPKLAREDILPKARENPRYLDDQGIRVFESWAEGAKEIDTYGMDWSKLDPARLSYKFRQDPGPHNSLGRIKFIFPNKFDVYLHDTPEKWLFGRTTRDLSSGCIRVEKPMELAEYLLRDRPEWTKEKILAAIEYGENHVIWLRDPIPVHLMYWTAWRADDARVQFREDIYARDASIFRALEQVPSEAGL